MGRSMQESHAAFRGVVTLSRTRHPYRNTWMTNEVPGTRKVEIVGPYTNEGVAKNQANKLARRYFSNPYWDVTNVLVECADNWHSVA